MKRILMYLLVLVTAGCASAPKNSYSGAGKVLEHSYSAKDNRVYTSIKDLLKQGKTVNLLLEYSSSAQGLPGGQSPADYGCQADRDMFLDTEKYFLLEAFSKYPNFSIVDRSVLDNTMKEMSLGMKGVTVSDLEPGQMKGATHLLMIEERNDFVLLFQDVRDHYAEIKKLVDMQKNTVLAIDKLSESRRVEYRPEPKQEEEPAEQRYVSPAIPSPLNDVPASVRALEQQQAQTLRNNEVITIHGSGSYQKPEAVESAPAQVVVVENGSPKTVVVQNGSSRAAALQARRTQQVGQTQVFQRVQGGSMASTIAMPAGGLQATIGSDQRGRPQPQQQARIQDWQFARVLKQQYPNLRSKDDKTVVRQFIKSHPAFSGRVAVDVK